jgi:hypothetical protein
MKSQKAKWTRGIVGIFVLLALLLPCSLTIAGTPNFQQTDLEECHVKKTTIYVAQVNNCVNNEMIDYEYLYFDLQDFEYNRSYCNGGTGHCFMDDPQCDNPPDETVVVYEYCIG